MNTIAARSVLKGRFVGLAIVLALLMAAAYGFAAANTVAASNAGDGSQAISGYDVSAVDYTLNGTDPSKIDAVGFNLAGAKKPGDVKTQLKSATGAWYACTTASTASPYAYTCSTTSTPITSAEADQLRVVAAD